MAYAIARVKKLKRANIAGSAAHTSRQRETPNADPTKQNIRFIGNVDREEKLEDLVLAKIGQYEQKRKIRTDAVYCVEILLTASPSYFRPLDPSAAGYYEEERLADWLSATQQWLEKEYGDRSPHRAVGNRIVRAELHLDEVTPHIHAYFVPLDENGQLRCNHFFDGRQKMRDFQESYFAAVQHLGLERGIRGSVAKHQDIKDFYRIVEEGKDLNSDLTIAQMRAKAADRDRAVQSKSSMERTAKRLVKENESLRQRIKELEAQKDQLQQQAEQLSDLPLEDVAWHLGLDQDTSSDVGHTVVGGDKVKFSTLKGDDAESSVQGNRLRRSVAERTKRTAIGSYRCWRRGEHIIYINGSQWSHLAPDTQKTDAIAGAITGTGAVALVKHINGCNFREAIAWLNDRFGEDGMQRAVTHYARQQAQMVIQEQEAPQFVPPVPDKSNWHLVHDYLTKKRRLPQDLLQKLYQWGLVYADDQQNAVFLLRNLDEKPTGALLLSTVDDDKTSFSVATGTKRSDGWFYLQWGGQPTDEIQKVVLLKSPLDVLSYAMLEVERHQGVPEERIMYMTVDSPRSLPVEFLQDIPEVICAYDHDAEGDTIAKAVSELLPQATRVKPQTQNWHEELLALLRWQQKEREYQQQQRQKQQRQRKRESELEL